MVSRTVLYDSGCCRALNLCSSASPQPLPQLKSLLRGTCASVDNRFSHNARRFQADC